MSALSRHFCRIAGAKKYYFPSPNNDGGEIAVMVHGLIRRGRNMMWLGRRINRAGYAVYLYDYATTTKNISVHGLDFLSFLQQVASNHPGKKINIVTHSMGGIITREALGCIGRGDGNCLKAENIGRIVMMAPPNHGSDMAKVAVKILPFSRRWIKPLGELSSAPDAYIHQVPVPDSFDIGIIAGRFDNKVSQRYTVLYGMKDHTVINTTHSLIMYTRQAAELAINYLRNGRFSEERLSLSGQQRKHGVPDTDPAPDA